MMIVLLLLLLLFCLVVAKVIPELARELDAAYAQSGVRSPPTSRPAR
jgi:hypothetical protein